MNVVYHVYELGDSLWLYERWAEIGGMFKPVSFGRPFLRVLDGMMAMIENTDTSRGNMVKLMVTPINERTIHYENPTDVDFVHLKLAHS